MKKLFLILGIALGAILLTITILLVATPVPKIITGVAAKRACSCHFIAKRSPAFIAANENKYSFIQYANIKYDAKQKTATATVLGVGKITAVYREGLGCAIVTDDYPMDVTKKLSFEIPEANPAPSIFTTDSSTPTINHEKLKTVINQAFTGEKKTSAVVVVKNNQIIGEQYGKGLNKNSLLLGWSMTKSITNTLTGILSKKGLVDIEQPVNIPEWKGDDRSKITWNNLLQMCSGLDWDENYFWISDVTKMLALRGDMYKHAILPKAKYKPTENFLYSSGTTNIVAGLQRRQFNDLQAYWAFPYEELFHKIGMHSAIMEPDASGTFVGSSYCFATARDWAKYGMLYLNDGVWQGNRILPEDWVDYTSKPAPNSNGKYGSFFWLNAGGQYPDAPREAYGAQGFQGQFVYIVPSQNLVVVRMGTGISGFDFNRFFDGRC